jgi:hypothetical protein
MSMMTNAPKINHTTTNKTAKLATGVVESTWENDPLAIKNELKSSKLLGVGTGRMAQVRSFVQ